MIGRRGSLFAAGPSSGPDDETSDPLHVRVRVCVLVCATARRPGPPPALTRWFWLAAERNYRMTAALMSARPPVRPLLIRVDGGRRLGV